MRSKRKRFCKSILAMALSLAMIMTMIMPGTAANAAAKPSLTKTQYTLLAGKQYDLNVKNRIRNSSYQWTTSDKKIASVSQEGVVKGIGKGIATITCKVTTQNHTYRLSCDFTVIKGAAGLYIANKVSALNVGQTYELDGIMTPASSNDLITWTSSDRSIADPDRNGNITALKQGTVTITGTTLSGKSASVTINVVDKDGTVTNQQELNQLVGSGASLITIKTLDETSLEIPRGNYGSQKLVVDAPNSDVTNCGLFSSIDIKQIKSDTWTEKANGNCINIMSSDSSIIIASGASVSIHVNLKNADLKINNSGTISDLTLAEGTNLDLSGDTDVLLPITIDFPNVSITSCIPLELNCIQKAAVKLLYGAEGTKIHLASNDVIPTMTGNIHVRPTVKLDDTTKEAACDTVALYAIETNSWSTIPSTTNASITSKGGTYTLRLEGSQAKLSSIASLYIKNIQGSESDTSIINHAKILINAVKFNGINCSVKQSAPEEAVSSSGVIDFCLLNEWAGANSEKITEVAQNSDKSYKFTASDYSVINSIEVTFTVTDVEVESEIPVIEPTATPLPTSTSAPTPTPTSAPAAVATPISSIQYDFAISGTNGETSLSFNYILSDWSNGTQNLAINGDGNYSITISSNNVAGIINMGYFTTISGSTISATLTNITINGSYAMSYPATLDIGSTYMNGLSNIWSVSTAGTKIAEGTNGYIALNSDKSYFVFYAFSASTPAATTTPAVSPTPTTAPTPAATNISSIQYDFTISGTNGESSLTFEYAPSDWNSSPQTLALNGDGNYSITITPNNVAGMINMGYIDPISGTSIKAALTKITVNGSYELNYSATLDVSSQNGLYNIWSGIDAGTKIAEGTNGYIALNSDKSYFVFYKTN